MPTFATPPQTPLGIANQIKGYFIWPDDIPGYAEQGSYDYLLVLISYIIVAIASYVALDIASRLPKSAPRSRRIKLCCGALAMGAGIWAMHFIGILAYKIPMLMTYDVWLTAASMLIAVLFSGAAFAVIQRRDFGKKQVILAAPLLGVAVCGMHYLGMQAMVMDAKILYRPDFFILSFVIATSASAAALYLMFHVPVSKRPTTDKILASLIMGIAVCGMHYTGMMASVMLPYADCRYAPEQNFSGLATAVSFITILIISIAFLVKQLDEALVEVQERTAQLFQSQKMDAVGQLTGGIAHDFNNILGVVIGSFDLLSRLSNLPEKATLFVKTGQESAYKASELIQRLLAFSRKQVLQPVPTDLGKLLPSTFILLQRSIDPAISLKSDIPDKLPNVLVDPIQLESAILNLALNARDAMPSGGVLSLIVKAVSVERTKADDLNIPLGKYVSISVGDTGTGITADIRDKIFDPFFTTKGQGKGNGLGLSMVAGFAEQSGGGISLETEINKGTVITLYLPVTSLAAQEYEENIPITSISHRNIILVDDEMELRNYLEISLKDAGHRVLATSSPSEALQLLSESSCDLLITDVLMPEMNGYDLADKALALNSQLKILFISGYSDRSSLPKHISQSVCAFLPKPFSFATLTLSIEKLLRPASPHNRAK